MSGNHVRNRDQNMLSSADNLSGSDHLLTDDQKAVISEILSYKFPPSTLHTATTIFRRSDMYLNAHRLTSINNKYLVALVNNYLVSLKVYSDTLQGEKVDNTPAVQDALEAVSDAKCLLETYINQQQIDLTIKETELPEPTPLTTADTDSNSSTNSALATSPVSSASVSESCASASPTGEVSEVVPTNLSVERIEELNARLATELMPNAQKMLSCACEIAQSPLPEQEGFSDSELDRLKEKLETNSAEYKHAKTTFENTKNRLVSEFGRTDEVESYFEGAMNTFERAARCYQFSYSYCSNLYVSYGDKATQPTSSGKPLVSYVEGHFNEHGDFVETTPSQSPRSPLSFMNPESSVMSLVPLNEAVTPSLRAAATPQYRPEKNEAATQNQMPQNQPHQPPQKSWFRRFWDRIVKLVTTCCSCFRKPSEPVTPIANARSSSDDTDRALRAEARAMAFV